MGWGTSFMRDLYISRKLFRNMYELNNEIEELGQYLNNIKTKILMYAIGDPKSFNNMGENQDSTIDSVFYNVTELLYEYEDCLFQHDLLIMYKESIEEGTSEFYSDKISHELNSEELI